MNFYASSEKERKLEKRIQRIVDLNCRRDQILEAPMLDLEGLAVLATDYEASNMPCAAADLRRRLIWHQGRSVKKKVESEGTAMTASRLPLACVRLGQ